MYNDNNEKAIRFGEAHLRQVGGRIKILQSEYDSMTGTAFNMGGVAARHEGLSKEERRGVILEERRSEILALSEEYRKLSLSVEDLKNCLTKREEWDESFFLAMSDANRSDIAEYTGTKTFMDD